MLKKAGYVVAGIGTGAGLSFASTFLVNLVFKNWESATLSGPTVATATGVGLYLRDINKPFSIAMATTGGVLLIRGAVYVFKFQKQFEQGKLATPPPEVKTMRTIVQAITPEEKGLKMPGMVKA